MRPKVAIVMALTNSSVKEAEELLGKSGGNVRNAIIKT
jgi:N-acetylmuramic acid 6-phosphate (MurNAc-6-P) etherase